MNNTHISRVHRISISVACDRTVYPKDAIVYVQAKLNSIILGELIIIEVYDLNKKLLVTKKIDPNIFDNQKLKSAGIYETSFVLKGNEWSIGSTYTVKAKHGNAESFGSFRIDRRNPIIQTDRSVYFPNSYIILTVIDPDSDLDSKKVETIGDKPSNKMMISTRKDKLANCRLTETDSSTGIFQAVIKLIPSQGSKTKNIDAVEETDYYDGGIQASIGDKITFTYSNQYQTVTLYAYASKFGASVELDQKVYTWTDKVIIAVIAPDYNLDSGAIDTIKVSIKTKNNQLSSYILEETDSNTGIFVGSVILTGNPKIKGKMGADGMGMNPSGKKGGIGPTDGFLPCEDNDSLTVSFEYTEHETVIGSALIRWNIGEVSWLKASYPSTEKGIIRVVDPDMNLNPEKIDSFKISIWSDTDANGIQLVVKETGESTGIFEGKVLFTKSGKSSENILRVSEGDTITAEYKDRTLPEPYTTRDELTVYATTTIGETLPPLERISTKNLMIVDKNNNPIHSTSVGQTVKIVANLTNKQNQVKSFVYLIRISDERRISLPLMGNSAKLKPKESIDIFQSWKPESPGTYNVELFVWKSIDEPEALSPSISTTITVN